MTSTNDGTEVKRSSNTPSPEKTRLVEVYKDLELTFRDSTCTFEKRLTYTCEAWKLLLKLFVAAAPNLRTFLLEWIHKNTANLLLQNAWLEKSKECHKEKLEKAIAQCMLAVFNAYKDDDTIPWVSSIKKKAEFFRRVSVHPWHYSPTVQKLVDNTEAETIDDETALSWLVEERGCMIVLRVQRMAQTKCYAQALSFTSSILKRMRKEEISTNHQSHNSDKILEEHKDGIASDGVWCTDFAAKALSDAGFTKDVLRTLSDAELVLLHKVKPVAECIERLKMIPLEQVNDLIQRLEENASKEKHLRIWRNAQEVAGLAAEMLVARCMLQPRVVGHVRTALIRGTKALVRRLKPEVLERTARVITAPASSAQHLFLFTIVIEKLCQETLQKFICEMLIRCIATGMNELEKLKAGENEDEIHNLEKNVSEWFMKLAILTRNNPDVHAECILTAFSVHPSQENFEKVKSSPIVERQDSIADDKHDVPVGTGWATDSKARSIYVKNSETIGLQWQVNDKLGVLSPAVIECKGLDFTPDMCKDLDALLRAPRVKTLSCLMDRDELLRNCIKYMEQPNKGTRLLTTELRYLRLKPDQISHLKEDEDDDNPYGIERGYEHCVELPNDELDLRHIVFNESSDVETDRTRANSVESEKKKPKPKKRKDDDYKPVLKTKKKIWRSKKVKHKPEEEVLEDPLSLEIKPKKKHKNKDDRPKKIKERKEKEVKKRGRKPSNSNFNKETFEDLISQLKDNKTKKSSVPDESTDRITVETKRSICESKYLPRKKIDSHSVKNRQILDKLTDSKSLVQSSVSDVNTAHTILKNSPKINIKDNNSDNNVFLNKRINSKNELQCNAIRKTGEMAASSQCKLETSKRIINLLTFRKNKKQVETETSHSDSKNIQSKQLEELPQLARQQQIDSESQLKLLQQKINLFKDGNQTISHLTQSKPEPFSPVLVSRQPQISLATPKSQSNTFLNPTTAPKDMPYTSNQGPLSGLVITYLGNNPAIFEVKSTSVQRQTANIPSKKIPTAKESNFEVKNTCITNVKSKLPKDIASGCKKWPASDRFEKSCQNFLREPDKLPETNATNYNVPCPSPQHQISHKSYPSLLKNSSGGPTATHTQNQHKSKPIILEDKLLIPGDVKSYYENFNKTCLQTKHISRNRTETVKRAILIDPLVIQPRKVLNNSKPLILNQKSKKAICKPQRILNIHKQSIFDGYQCIKPNNTTTDANKFGKNRHQQTAAKISASKKCHSKANHPKTPLGKKLEKKQRPNQADQSCSTAIDEIDAPLLDEVIDKELLAEIIESITVDETAIRDFPTTEKRNPFDETKFNELKATTSKIPSHLRAKHSYQTKTDKLSSGLPFSLPNELINKAKVEKLPLESINKSEEEHARDLLLKKLLSAPAFNMREVSSIKNPPNIRKPNIEEATQVSKLAHQKIDKKMFINLPENSLISTCINEPNTFTKRAESNWRSFKEQLHPNIASKNGKYLRTKEKSKIINKETVKLPNRNAPNTINLPEKNPNPSKNLHNTTTPAIIMKTSTNPCEKSSGIFKEKRISDITAEFKESSCRENLNADLKISEKPKSMTAKKNSAPKNSAKFSKISKTKNASPKTAKRSSKVHENSEVENNKSYLYNTKQDTPNANAGSVENILENKHNLILSVSKPANLSNCQTSMKIDSLKINSNLSNISPISSTTIVTQSSIKALNSDSTNKAEKNIENSLETNKSFDLMDFENQINVSTIHKIVTQENKRKSTDVNPVKKSEENMMLSTVKNIEHSQKSNAINKVERNQSQQISIDINSSKVAQPAGKKLMSDNEIDVSWKRDCTEKTTMTEVSINSISTSNTQSSNQFLIAETANIKDKIIEKESIQSSTSRKLIAGASKMYLTSANKSLLRESSHNDSQNFIQQSAKSLQRTVDSCKTLNSKFEIPVLSVNLDLDLDDSEPMRSNHNNLIENKAIPLVSVAPRTDQTVTDKVEKINSETSARVKNLTRENKCKGKIDSIITNITRLLEADSKIKVKNMSLQQDQTFQSNKLTRSESLSGQKSFANQNAENTKTVAAASKLNECNIPVPQGQTYQLNEFGRKSPNNPQKYSVDWIENKAECDRIDNANVKVLSKTEKLESDTKNDKQQTHDLDLDMEVVEEEAFTYSKIDRKHLDTEVLKIITPRTIKPDEIKIYSAESATPVDNSERVLPVTNPPTKSPQLTSQASSQISLTTSVFLSTLVDLTERVLPGKEPPVTSLQLTPQGILQTSLNTYSPNTENQASTLVDLTKRELPDTLPPATPLKLTPQAFLQISPTKSANTEKQIAKSVDLSERDLPVKNPPAKAPQLTPQASPQTSTTTYSARNEKQASNSVDLTKRVLSVKRPPATPLLLTPQACSQISLTTSANTEKQLLTSVDLTESVFPVFNPPAKALQSKPQAFSQISLTTSANKENKLSTSIDLTERVLPGKNPPVTSLHMTPQTISQTSLTTYSANTEKQASTSVKQAPISLLKTKVGTSSIHDSTRIASNVIQNMVPMVIPALMPVTPKSDINVEKRMLLDVIDLSSGNESSDELLGMSKNTNDISSYNSTVQKKNQNHFSDINEGAISLDNGNALKYENANIENNHLLSKNYEPKDELVKNEFKTENSFNKNKTVEVVKRIDSSQKKKRFSKRTLKVPKWKSDFSEDFDSENELPSQHGIKPNAVDNSIPESKSFCEDFAIERKPEKSFKICAFDNNDEFHQDVSQGPNIAQIHTNIGSNRDLPKIELVGISDLIMPKSNQNRSRKSKRKISKDVPKKEIVDIPDLIMPNSNQDRSKKAKRKISKDTVGINEDDTKNMKFGTISTNLISKSIANISLPAFKCNKKSELDEKRTSNAAIIRNETENLLSKSSTVAFHRNRNDSKENIKTLKEASDHDDVVVLDDDEEIVKQPKANAVQIKTWFVKGKKRSKTANLWTPEFIKSMIPPGTTGRFKVKIKNVVGGYECSAVPVEEISKKVTNDVVDLISDEETDVDFIKTEENKVDLISDEENDVDLISNKADDIELEKKPLMFGTYTVTGPNLQLFPNNLSKLNIPCQVIVDRLCPKIQKKNECSDKTKPCLVLIDNKEVDKWNMEQNLKIAAKVSNEKPFKCMIADDRVTIQELGLQERTGCHVTSKLLQLCLNTINNKMERREGERNKLKQSQDPPSDVKNCSPKRSCSMDINLPIKIESNGGYRLRIQDSVNKSEVENIKKPNIDVIGSNLYQETGIFHNSVENSDKTIPNCLDSTINTEIEGELDKGNLSKSNSIENNFEEFKREHETNAFEIQVKHKYNNEIAEDMSQVQTNEKKSILETVSPLSPAVIDKQEKPDLRNAAHCVSTPIDIDMQTKPLIENFDDDLMCHVKTSSLSLQILMESDSMVVIQNVGTDSQSHNEISKGHNEIADHRKDICGRIQTETKNLDASKPSASLREQCINGNNSFDSDCKSQNAECDSLTAYQSFISQMDLDIHSMKTLRGISAESRKDEESRNFVSESLTTCQYFASQMDSEIPKNMASVINFELRKNEETFKNTSVIEESTNDGTINHSQNLSNDEFIEADDIIVNIPNKTCLSIQKPILTEIKRSLYEESVNECVDSDCLSIISQNSVFESPSRCQSFASQMDSELEPANMASVINVELSKNEESENFTSKSTTTCQHFAPQIDSEIERKNMMSVINNELSKNKESQNLVFESQTTCYSFASQMDSEIEAANMESVMNVEVSKNEQSYNFVSESPTICQSFASQINSEIERQNRVSVLNYELSKNDEFQNFTSKTRTTCQSFASSIDSEIERKNILRVINVELSKNQESQNFVFESQTTSHSFASKMDAKIEPANTESVTSLVLSKHEESQNFSPESPTTCQSFSSQMDLEIEPKNTISGINGESKKNEETLKNINNATVIEDATNDGAINNSENISNYESIEAEDTIVNICNKTCQGIEKQMLTEISRSLYEKCVTEKVSFDSDCQNIKSQNSVPESQPTCQSFASRMYSEIEPTIMENLESKKNEEALENGNYVAVCGESTNKSTINISENLANGESIQAEDTTAIILNLNCQSIGKPMLTEITASLYSAECFSSEIQTFETLVNDENKMNFDIDNNKCMPIHSVESQSNKCVEMACDALCTQSFVDSISKYKLLGGEIAGNCISTQLRETSTNRSEQFNKIHDFSEGIPTDVLTKGIEVSNIAYPNIIPELQTPKISLSDSKSTSSIEKPLQFLDSKSENILKEIDSRENKSVEIEIPRNFCDDKSTIKSEANEQVKNQKISREFLPKINESNNDDRERSKSDISSTEKPLLRFDSKSESILKKKYSPENKSVEVEIPRNVCDDKSMIDSKVHHEQIENRNFSKEFLPKINEIDSDDREIKVSHIADSSVLFESQTSSISDCSISLSNSKNDISSVKEPLLYFDSNSENILNLIGSPQNESVEAEIPRNVCDDKSTIESEVNDHEQTETQFFSSQIFGEIIEIDNDDREIKVSHFADSSEVSESKTSLLLDCSISISNSKCGISSIDEPLLYFVSSSENKLKEIDSPEIKSVKVEIPRNVCDDKSTIESEGNDHEQIKNYNFSRELSPTINEIDNGDEEINIADSSIISERTTSSISDCSISLSNSKNDSSSKEEPLLYFDSNSENVLNVIGSPQNESVEAEIPRNVCDDESTIESEVNDHEQTETQFFSSQISGKIIDIDNDYREIKESHIADSSEVSESKTSLILDCSISISNSKSDISSIKEPLLYFVSNSENKLKELDSPEINSVEVEIPRNVCDDKSTIESEGNEHEQIKNYNFSRELSPKINEIDNGDEQINIADSSIISERTTSSISDCSIYLSNSKNDSSSKEEPLLYFDSNSENILNVIGSPQNESVEAEIPRNVCDDKSTIESEVNDHEQTETQFFSSQISGKIIDIDNDDREIKESHIADSSEVSESKTSLILDCSISISNSKSDISSIKEPLLYFVSNSENKLKEIDSPEIKSVEVEIPRNVCDDKSTIESEGNDHEQIKNYNFSRELSPKIMEIDNGDEEIADSSIVSERTTSSISDCSISLSNSKNESSSIEEPLLYFDSNSENILNVIGFPQNESVEAEIPRNVMSHIADPRIFSESTISSISDCSGSLNNPKIEISSIEEPLLGCGSNLENDLKQIEPLEDRSVDPEIPDKVYRNVCDDKSSFESNIEEEDSSREISPLNDFDNDDDKVEVYLILGDAGDDEQTPRSFLINKSIFLPSDLTANEVSSMTEEGFSKEAVNETFDIFRSLKRVSRSDDFNHNIKFAKLSAEIKEEILDIRMNEEGTSKEAVNETFDSSRSLKRVSRSDDFKHDIKLAKLSAENYYYEEHNNVEDEPALCESKVDIENDISFALNASLRTYPSPKRRRKRRYTSSIRHQLIKTLKEVEKIKTESISLQKETNDVSCEADFNQRIEYKKCLNLSLKQTFLRAADDIDMNFKIWPLQQIHMNANLDFNEEDHRLPLFEDLEETNENFIYSLEENQYQNREPIPDLGFGEGSDRVKLFGKVGGEMKSYSAVALSDVKNQPLRSVINSENNENMYKPAGFDVNKRKLLFSQINAEVKSFFKNKKEYYKYIISEKSRRKSIILKNVPGMNSCEYMDPCQTHQSVNVVQIGQLPVNVTAQNSVNCSNSVSQASASGSPSQCPGEGDIQKSVTASVENVESCEQNTAKPNPTPDKTINDSRTSVVIKKNDVEGLIDENKKFDTEVEPPNDIREKNNCESKQSITTDSPANIVITSNSGVITQCSKTDFVSENNGKASNVLTPSSPRTFINILSQKVIRPPTSVANQLNSNTNMPKSNTMNTMTFQQALAQILPSVSQAQPTDLSQQPQLLHFVSGKATTNSVTLVDNNVQNSHMTNQNTTQLLHIVQNKASSSTLSANGSQIPVSSAFSGLQFVEAGVQGANQVLHLVNAAANQAKNSATTQLLKRVNLLTGLTNVGGTNEQKMVQFLCKSPDGKSLQLGAGHQRSMVLRLQPIENSQSTSMAAQPKSNESSDVSQNLSVSKDNAQVSQEIKSRSIYEDSYAKFVQSSTGKPVLASEKGTCLPKFNQVFGKTVYQDEGKSLDNDATNVEHIVNSIDQHDSPQQKNESINVEDVSHISSPPLLLRKTSPHTQHQNVQQLKSGITPVNIQTMHGGVIYTRQIPVNIGGGQTINLITVPSTEMLEDGNHKNENKIDSESQPVIKLVPHPQNISFESSGEQSSSQTDAQTNALNQVLTQMRIKLPMLSKGPQMVGGARLMRPFLQIQRNVLGGTNQPVYQQLVLTTAPSLGQQTVRLPQPQTKQKVTDKQGDNNLSTSTLEQLREFDMVLEQVKERSTVQPQNPFGQFAKLQDVSENVVTSLGETPVLYSISGNQTLIFNRKSVAQSPDSSDTAQSPSSTQVVHLVSDSSFDSQKPKTKNKIKLAKPIIPPATPIKTAPIPQKTTTQKPLEDEQTTQRILYILAEYKEQVENSPDKDKPAPRRRTNPPTNPGSSKKKKSSSNGGKKPGGSSVRDSSPVGGSEDLGRTMGSEDSSCGTSQGDCAESCTSVDVPSPQGSPQKTPRKLVFDTETAQTPPPVSRPQHNVIVADGQTIALTRSTTGKPTTAVLMPANYLLPVSMMKGGQQIAIVTNRGPKLLTVPQGESGTANNTLLLQRLIGPAGLKPLLARPGVRHVRLPTVQNLQQLNIQDQNASARCQPAASTKATETTSQENWTENSKLKQEDESATKNEESWNITPSTEASEYTNFESSSAGNEETVERTVLVMPKKDLTNLTSVVSHGQSFMIHQKAHQSGTSSLHSTVLSAAALRNKYAILEHELRLQKSLSEECEDLGVDSPSASDLFPEAELLFAASPAHMNEHSQDTGDMTQQQHIQQNNVGLSANASSSNHSANDRLEAISAMGPLSPDTARILAAGAAALHEDFARSHPNTTFHSEPAEDEMQQFAVQSSGVISTASRHTMSQLPVTQHIVTIPQTITQQRLITQHHTKPEVQHEAAEMQHVSEMQHDTSEMQHDTSEMQHDTSEMQHNTSEMQHDLSEMHHDVGEVHQVVADSRPNVIQRAVHHSIEDESASSPERYWESNDSTQCDSQEETDSEHSSQVGSVIKSCAPRTYLPARKVSGKRVPESSEGSSRRISNRGVVKRGCHCCNGNEETKSKKPKLKPRPSV